MLNPLQCFLFTTKTEESFAFDIEQSPGARTIIRGGPRNVRFGEEIVGGLDYDGDPRAGEQLDGFVRKVQAVLARYEGTLVQLTIGDKGSYLYAAFGAPVAHDDAVGATQDWPVIARVLDNDVDPDGELTYGQVSIITGQIGRASCRERV